VNWFKRNTKNENPVIVESEPQAEKQRFVSLDEVDPLFISAGQFALGRNRLVTTDLQRQFIIGNTRANDLFDVLEKAGVIQKRFDNAGSTSGYKFYGVPCMTQTEWAQYLQGCVSCSGNRPKPEVKPAVEEAETDIDSLTGEEFELFCAKLLSKSGYSGIELTKATGDRGIDITANKDGIRYAFQCKRYTGGVGNAAVQEAYSGKSIYNVDVAVVITNSYFTEQAKDDAEKLRVRLWDRDKLLTMQKIARIR